MTLPLGILQRTQKGVRQQATKGGSRLRGLFANEAPCFYYNVSRWNQLFSLCRIKDGVAMEKVGFACRVFSRLLCEIYAAPNMQVSRRHPVVVLVIARLGQHPGRQVMCAMMIAVILIQIKINGALRRWLCPVVGSAMRIY